MDKSNQNKDKKSFLIEPVSLLAILADLVLLMYEGGGMLSALAAMAMLPIILINFLNYKFVECDILRVLKKPLVALVILLLSQIALALLGISLNILKNGGIIVSCMDSCSESSFSNVFFGNLIMFQFAFIGGYVAIVKGAKKRKNVHEA